MEERKKMGKSFVKSNYRKIASVGYLTARIKYKSIFYTYGRNVRKPGFVLGGYFELIERDRSFLHSRKRCCFSMCLHANFRRWINVT